MKPQPRTLRQQKLWWCANHNSQMATARNAPVSFALKGMPEFIRTFDDRYESAKNALNQYLGSPKPDYWKTRPAHVAELCEALSLSQDIWDEPDFASFADRAAHQLAARGLFDAAAQAAVRSRQAELVRLSHLPIEDGRGQLALQRDDHALSGFRRSPEATEWPHLRMHEPVRVQIRATTGHFVVAFTIDPHSELCALLPSDGKPAAQSDGSVLLFPPASAEPMYPPDKADWHELIVAIGPETPDPQLSLPVFGEPLEVAEIGRLVNHCEHTVASGGTLRRLYFHVAE